VSDADSPSSPRNDGSLPLLGLGDPAPVTVHNSSGSAPVLFVCDHASAAVPASLNDLGLSPEWLRQHIAIDIGAWPLACALAERFDAPAVGAGFSRLVIDLNRFPGADGSIPAISDRTQIPGNMPITVQECAAREREVFVPYHEVVAEQVQRLWARASEPLVVSVHSFTPTMDGVARPWHVGVLSSEDRRIADPLLQYLRARPGLVVGDNKPYSAIAPFGYTTVKHCEEGGLLHALIEIRQDELDRPEGISRWTGILHDALSSIPPLR
jgi:predicted N-formylglutamate amidohydrolase